MKVSEVSAAIERVERYLEGRALMPSLDQEEIHGIGVGREDEIRTLLVSDLNLLLDALIQEPEDSRERN